MYAFKQCFTPVGPSLVFWFIFRSVNSACESKLIAEKGIESKLVSMASRMMISNSP